MRTGLNSLFLLHVHAHPSSQKPSRGHLLATLSTATPAHLLAQLERAYDIGVEVNTALSRKRFSLFIECRHYPAASSLVSLRILQGASPPSSRR
mmetsp:Transcript_18959/g.57310  ORF Transcript_18959/g.57310 Transcript_18959/m.57310 type:complete len:94 (+) Transcript_18959:860-1141(+)